MRREPTSRCTAVLCACALLWSLPLPAGAASWEWATGPSVMDEEGQRDWSVEVIPYLWLAGISGRLGLPDGTGTIPVDADFGAVASNLDAGLSGLLDVRFRRWHLFSDNFWVKLGGKQQVEVPGLFPPLTTVEAKLDSSVALGTVALAYELPLKRSFALDVYMAARWWHVTNGAKLTFETSGPGTPGPFTGEITETWADAVAGLRWHLAITEKWQVSASADVGAGAAKLDWSVVGSVGYFFNHTVGMTVAYRVLGVDYSNDGFVYDIRQQGLLLGLNLRY